MARDLYPERTDRRGLQKNLRAIEALLDRIFDHALMFNVQDYGARTAAANNADAFQRAIDAASGAGGGLVFVPGGTWVLSGPSGSPILTLASNVHLRLAPGATLDFSTGTIGAHDNFNEPFIYGSGSVGGAVALSSDAAAGDSVIAVASVAGLVAGDLLEISSAATVDSSQPVARGELAYIASISGTDITLQTSLADSYATADTAVIKKVTPIRNSSIAGGRILGPGHPGSGNGDHGITYRYGVGVAVHDVVFEKVDRICVEFMSCLYFQSRDCTAYFEPPGANPSTQYGCFVANASRFGVIDGWFQRGGRHAYAFGHTQTQPGIQREVVFRDCSAVNCVNAAWMTHGSSNGVVFEGGWSRNCGHGWGIRSPNVEIRGGRAHDVAAAGFHLYLLRGGDALRASGVVADGGTQVVKLDAMDADPTDCSISDSVFENVSAGGIILDSKVDAGLKVWRIQNVTVRNGGAAATHRGLWVIGRYKVDWIGGLIENFGGEGVDGKGLRNSYMAFTINDVGTSAITIRDDTSPAVVSDWNDFRQMVVAGHNGTAVNSSGATGVNNQTTPAMDHGTSNLS